MTSSPRTVASLLNVTLRASISGLLEVALRLRRDGNGYIDFASDAGRHDFVGVLSILHLGVVVGDGGFCFHRCYSK